MVKSTSYKLGLARAFFGVILDNFNAIISTFAGKDMQF
jgi:hypothetical protein